MGESTEPKIEQDLKEGAKKELEHALRRLHGLMEEGIIKVPLDQLDFAIKAAQESIRKAKELLEN